MQGQLEHHNFLLYIADRHTDMAASSGKEEVQQAIAAAAALRSKALKGHNVVSCMILPRLFRRV